ncbi:hypothetical protein [Bremerella cremea]|uniref:hypothetical protein n=1 Tax=Bremerella cremea TaxID=1031537 RepID=UPI0031E8C427
MSCDWKQFLQRELALLSDPLESASIGPGLSPALSTSSFRKQRHNPVQSPPPWLCRRMKRPAQRGGPRV